MSHGDEASFNDFQRGPYQPPRVRFDAIGQAWQLFKNEPITWMTTGCFVVVCNWIATGLIFFLLEEQGPKGMAAFRSPLPPLELTVNTLVSSAINGFFLGGMFRMACLQVRGNRIHFRDFLSVTNVFFELVTGAVLYTLICLIGGALCLIPGLVASGLLMFTIPLIVDGRLTALDALNRSFQVLKSEWLMVTIFNLVAYLLTGLGACCCWVGLLVTMPLYSLSISVLYRDYFLSKGSTGFATSKSGDPYF